MNPTEAQPKKPAEKVPAVTESRVGEDAPWEDDDPTPEEVAFLGRAWDAVAKKDAASAGELVKEAATLGLTPPKALSALASSTAATTKPEPAATPDPVA